MAKPDKKARLAEDLESASGLSTSASSANLVPKEELKSMLETFESDIKTMLDKELDKRFEQHTTVFKQSSHSLIQRYDEMQSAKMAEMAAHVATLKSDIARVDKSTVDLWSAVHALQGTVAAVDVPQEHDATAELEREEFTRPPDRGILRIGTPEEVPKSCIQAGILDWLSEAGIKESDWQLRGPTCGKQFKLVFNGLNGLCARRAKKANLFLKDEDGAWKTIHVQTPTGNSVRLYIDMDKNRQQLAVERLGKKVANALMAAYPTKKFYLRKAAGLIFLPGNKGICKLEVPTRDDPQIMWNPSLISSEEIDKQAILDAVAKDDGGIAATGPIMWSL